MDKRKVLLQFDTDLHPSSFDSLVAIDSDIEVVLPYGEVDVDSVVDLIHGAMFTRGPADLCRTAAFIGGSQVALAEQLFERCKEAFFGPIRVSLLLDPSGANTTTAAAIRCVERHFPLAGRKVAVFGGTGPVGMRLAQLSAGLGAEVFLCSRTLVRATEAVAQVQAKLTGGNLQAAETPSDVEALALARKVDVLFAAGAAGAEFLPAGWFEKVESVRVAVDINAVPPVGLAGVDPHDAGKARGNVPHCYGALAVGGLKMRVHKACLRALFETNQKLLSTQEIYEVAQHF